jgi:putative colanic acid biosynthesis acetyltransferase WcaF
MMQLDQFKLHRPLFMRLMQGLWLIISFLFFTTFFPWPSRIKAIILRVFGAQVGHGLIIRPNVYIKLPWNLSIGSDVWIGYGVHLDNDELITIGESSCLSQHTKIFTGSHDFKSEGFDFVSQQVKIGSGCWIAACCVVLPGVVIKDGNFCKAGTIIKKGGSYEDIVHYADEKQ